MSRNLLILSVLLSAILITEACLDVCRLRQDNHFAPNPRGCAWYNRCNVGIPAEEGRCPDPYYFNFEKQVCDWRQNVNCTETNNYPTSCPSAGIAIIPHPNVCSKYTVCIDGQQEDRACAPGLHFSYYDGKCVEPFIADCTKDRDFCIARNGGSEFTGWFRTINQRSCNEYYVCTNNEMAGVIGAAVMRCAQDLHVNPYTFECQASNLAGCDINDVPNPPAYPGLNISFDCTEELEGKTITHPATNCFWFFCSAGQSNLFQCDYRTHYDANSKSCILGNCTPPTTRSVQQGSDFVGRNFENESTLIQNYMEMLQNRMRN